jgi:hypothetical protein
MRPTSMIMIVSLFLSWNDPLMIGSNDDHDPTTTETQEEEEMVA